MLRFSSTVALIIATLVSVSAAQPSLEPAAEVTDLATRNQDDAAAGRTYLGPTALTLPEGAAALTLRIPFLPAVEGTLGGGVTDRLEVSVGGAAAVVLESESTNPNRVASAGAKFQLARARRFALALTASIHRREAFRDLDSFAGPPRDVPTRVAAGVGLALSACLDHACAVMLGAHVHPLVDLTGGDQTSPYGGASLAIGRGRHRAVVDATVIPDDDDASGLGYVGYRAAGTKISFDLGLVIAKDAGGIFPWPTTGMSARF